MYKSKHMSKDLAYSGDVQAGIWLKQSEWRIVSNFEISSLKAYNTSIKISPNLTEHFRVYAIVM